VTDLPLFPFQAARLSTLLDEILGLISFLDLSLICGEGAPWRWRISQEKRNAGGGLCGAATIRFCSIHARHPLHSEAIDILLAAVIRHPSLLLHPDPFPVHCRTIIARRLASAFCNRSQILSSLFHYETQSHFERKVES